MSDSYGWAIAGWSIIGTVIVLGGGFVLISRNFSRDGIINFFKETVGKNLFAIVFAFSNFIPFGLLMFGFISDILNEEFRNSFISLVVIAVTILFGWLTQFFASQKGYNLAVNKSSLYSSGWCTLPGLENFESPYFPMSFFSTGTLIAYYGLFGYWKGANTASMTIWFPIVITIQLLAFYWAECHSSYISLAYGMNHVISTIIGVIFGFIMAALVNSNSPQYSPFAGRTDTNYKSTDNGQSAAGHGYGGTGPTLPPKYNSVSYPVDTSDDNTFVAEIYKNGQLVTEKIA